MRADARVAAAVIALLVIAVLFQIAIRKLAADELGVSLDPRDQFDLDPPENGGDEA